MRIELLKPRSLSLHTIRLRQSAGVIAVLAAALSGDVSADEYLDPIGGRGGGRFEAYCPADQFLAGFQLRAGDDVDAIRPLCVAVYGPRDVSPPASESNWFGGSGGGLNTVACTTYRPVVTGMFVSAEGETTVVVNNIHLFCGLAVDSQEASDAPSALFDAPNYDAGALNGFIGGSKNTQHCPAGQVAVGVHGRSGIWVDAIGLICGAAPPGKAPAAPARTTVTSIGKTSARTTVTSIGKVLTGTPSKAHPAQHICDSARNAQVRNSPAASNLQAQCLAAGGPLLGAPIPPSPQLPVPSPPPPVPQSGDSDKRAARDAVVTGLIGILASKIHPSRPTVNDMGGSNNARRRGDQDLRSNRRATQTITEASTRASPPQKNLIRVEVRYPAAYGYKDAAGLFDPGPNSCGAFYISAFPASGARQRDPARIDTQPQMREANGVYACDYLIRDQPIGTPVIVRVAMSDQRAAGNETWLGGSEPQPPVGARRMIVDGDRQIVLRDDQASAPLNFEMVYSGAR